MSVVSTGLEVRVGRLSGPLQDGWANGDYQFTRWLHV